MKTNYTTTVHLTFTCKGNLGIKRKTNISFQEFHYFLMRRAWEESPRCLWLARPQLSASGPGAPWPKQQCCLKNAGQRKTKKDVSQKTDAACGAHGFQTAPRSLTSAQIVPHLCCTNTEETWGKKNIYLKLETKNKTFFLEFCFFYTTQFFLNGFYFCKKETS